MLTGSGMEAAVATSDGRSNRPDSSLDDRSPWTRSGLQKYRNARPSSRKRGDASVQTEAVPFWLREVANPGERQTAAFSVCQGQLVSVILRALTTLRLPCLRRMAPRPCAAE